MLFESKLLKDPEVFNSPEFEYKDRETYNSRLLNQKAQHSSVSAYLNNMGFYIFPSEKETIGWLKHPVYGDIVVFFYYNEEPIGTFKKLLINRNGSKSSRQILYKIININIAEYYAKISTGKAA